MASTKPGAVFIDENIDDNDEMKFQYRPAIAWRWDKDQSKWRFRGKGEITIYYNKTRKLSKIIFVDEKYHKTRILQWIDGENSAKFAVDVRANNYPMKFNKEYVEWFGSDYSMSPIHPMTTKWKIAFIDNATVAKRFVDLFNAPIYAIIKKLTYGYLREVLNKERDYIFIIALIFEFCKQMTIEANENNK